MPEFYIKIARKKFSRILGGHVPPAAAPVSYVQLGVTPDAVIAVWTSYGLGVQVAHYLVAQLHWLIVFNPGCTIQTFVHILPRSLNR